MTAGERKILLIASDALGQRMAGPGIRMWELARVLSGHFRVTLAVPPFLADDVDPPIPDFEARALVCRKTRELRALVSETDVVITLGTVAAVYPFLTRIAKPLVVDSYDPFLLAGLEQHRGFPRDERIASHERYLRAHSIALRAADLVLCASDRQRDYFLGMLSALGRVNPAAYDRDSRLRHLIRVVPFGLPSLPPRHTRQVLKGVHPGVAVDDRVVLWGGGVWTWFDAPTAVKAISRIARSRADVKLFFMGVDRPNRSVNHSAAAREARELSRSLGVADRAVFFNEWVSYDDRQNYLLEADVGISLHPETVESRFAFRSRFLDYFWAGLPVVATEGDVLSERVRQAGVGELVAPGDDRSVAAAILKLLETPDLKAAYRPRFTALAEEFHWEETAKPLIEFCRDPRLAPDKASADGAGARALRRIKRRLRRVTSRLRARHRAPLEAPMDS
jgi:glycosyltransferase involved in cell wall biosynthesis